MTQPLSLEGLLEGFKYELECSCKAKTVEYYDVHLRRFICWARTVGIADDIRSITKRHIQIFFHHLLNVTETATGGNGSHRVIRRTEQSRWPYYRSLRRFLSWAVEEGYIESNPMVGLRMKAPQAPPIEPYQPQHVTRMMAVLEHDWRIAKTSRQRMLAARDKAVLLLFLESGLRCGELALLTVPDVDLERRRAIVRHGKMDKGRMVGFGPETKKALWRYMNQRVSEENALWLTEEGRPMKLGGIRQIIRRLKVDAGLQHVKGSVHKLRHTFATLFLRETRDMKGCKNLLGHSSLTMTERYTEFVDTEDALKAYNGKGPLDWMKGKSS